MKAGGVTVKVRYSDFRTVTRSRALPPRPTATASCWPPRAS